jgi:hypothetical protein
MLCGGGVKMVDTIIPKLIYTGSILLASLLLINYFLHFKIILSKNKIQNSLSFRLLMAFTHPIIVTVLPFIEYLITNRRRQKKSFSILIKRILLIFERYLMLPFWYFLPIVLLSAQSICQFLYYSNKKILNIHLNNFFHNLAKKTGIKDWVLLKKFVNSYCFGMYYFFDHFSKLKSGYSQDCLGNTIFLYHFNKKIIGFSDVEPCINDMLKIYANTYSKTLEAFDHFFLLEILSRIVFINSVVCALVKSKDKIIENINLLNQIIDAHNNDIVDVNDYLKAPVISNLLHEFYQIHLEEHKSNN